MSGSSNTLQTYLELITSEHSGRPNYVAFVTALIQPLIDSQVLYQELLTTFDINTAVGVQLDAVGKWVGRARTLTTPLSGVYFSWDTPGLGWDQGSWQGAFSPSSGITSLDDDTYRALLQAKVIMNSWDGSIPVAALALETLFGVNSGTLISIQDNQDMTMDVSISGVIPPAVVISLLQGGYVPIVPEGVGVNYLITSVNTSPLFGFDIENRFCSGWDVGAWDGSSGGVIPGAPVGLSIAASTSTSFTLAWLAPTSGTGPFTYQMQYQLGTGSNVWVLVGSPVTTTQETISGLQANTTYSFEVYAINENGAGPPSQYITATTSSGIPGQVTGLLATATTETTASLSWNSVTGNGISYQVTSTPANAYAVPTTTLTYTTVTGLTVGTTYVFEVYALNSYGSGPSSSPLTISTAGATPGVVQNLTVAIVNSNDVILNWGPPITSNGPYTYVVQYAQNINPIAFQTFTGTTYLANNIVSIDVTGLTSNTPYLFTVYAVNSAGNGITSPAVSATTGSSLPVAPTGLSASAINQTGCTLQWNAAFDASTYQLQQAYATSPSVFTNAASATAALSQVLSDLTIGTSYIFQVYGINASGQKGPASSPLAVTTSGVIPGQVPSLTVGTPTNSTVPLSWTAPTTGTGTPSYQVQYKLATGTTFTNYGSPVLTLTTTVTGLQSASTYDFQVYAINNFGSGPPSPVAIGVTTGTLSTVTWNPSDHTSNISLSNLNLEALSIAPPVTNVTGSPLSSGLGFSLAWTASNPTGYYGVRGTESVTTGMVYVEFTLSGSTTDFAVGVASSSWNFATTGLGKDTNSLGIYPNAS